MQPKAARAPQRAKSSPAVRGSAALQQRPKEAQSSPATPPAPTTSTRLTAARAALAAGVQAGLAEELLSEMRPQ
eukprot:7452196-Lingulodinium_polyedra.AAC.1